MQRPEHTSHINTIFDLTMCPESALAQHALVDLFSTSAVDRAMYAQTTFITPLNSLRYDSEDIEYPNMIFGIIAPLHYNVAFGIQTPECGWPGSSTSY
ncbi:unnamed protein product [Somion occarium]|uniref:Uncharacterized protein n=1 Tax=Somion occarium TaxID=3059160 RepID=A0ABP1E6S7_9APHY